MKQMIFKEIQTKCLNVGPFEMSLIKDQIQKIPAERLKDFAEELFADVDNVGQYGLNYKAVKHYSEKQINDFYEPIVNAISNKLLTLRQKPLPEGCRLFYDGFLVLGTEELLEFVQKGFQKESLQRIVQERVYRVQHMLEGTK